MGLCNESSLTRCGPRRSEEDDCAAPREQGLVGERAMFAEAGLSSPSGGCQSFSPTSVQFKDEISDAFPRKRHQQRHLEFCIA
jgi:hypothetical protein